MWIYLREKENNVDICRQQAGNGYGKGKKLEYKLKRLKRETVCHGSVLDFCRDTMKLPDGSLAQWDFVRHPTGGACVVPVLSDGRILLERQYRPAIDRETLELPAGARDSGQEDSMDAAARELEEETGYRCGKIRPLIRLKTAVSWCNEFTDVYLAEELEKLPERRLDAAEEISLVALGLEEILAKIYSGELQDAKTVAGILAYACCRNGGNRG
jgi:ADP-ribose pyrophosphatase